MRLEAIDGYVEEIWDQDVEHRAAHDIDFNDGEGDKEEEDRVEE